MGACDQPGDELNPNRLAGLGIRIDDDRVLGGDVLKFGEELLTPLGGLLTEGLKEFCVPTFTAKPPVRFDQPLTPDCSMALVRYLVYRGFFGVGLTTCAAPGSFVGT